MPENKRPGREELHEKILKWLLRYRRLFLGAGMMLMAYALMMLIVSLPAGVLVAALAALPLLLGISFKAAVITARLLAWMASPGRR